MSLGEMVMVAVLALVFIGPDDLPKMMRLAGRYYAKIRRASDELRRAFNAEVAKVEAEERREEMKKRREEMERRRAELQAKIAAQQAMKGEDASGKIAEGPSTPASANAPSEGEGVAVPSSVTPEGLNPQSDGVPEAVARPSGVPETVARPPVVRPPEPALDPDSPAANLAALAALEAAGVEEDALVMPPDPRLPPDAAPMVYRSRPKE